jgi:hypothetical protein
MRISLAFIIWVIAVFAFFLAILWAGLSMLEHRYKDKKGAHIS